MTIQEKIIYSVQDAIRATEQLITPHAVDFMTEVAQALTQAFMSGNKVIIAGNGGSLCDASHFAEELTGFFRNYRAALPAIALSEPGHITCVGNDIGFEWVFSRGVEAYGKPGDIFVGLTTSGNSINLVNAFETAKRLGLTTVAFLGKEGGKIKGMSEYELIIEGFKTSDRIQEAHMVAIHTIIEITEHLIEKTKEQQTIPLNAALS